jgi:hypothetical protein
MVAEVVLSVMGNRSDRRFVNLSNFSGPRGVEPNQDKARRFPSGPGAFKQSSR